jgi:tetratricopeptide (TPR) repeat protein
MIERDALETLRGPDPARAAEAEATLWRLWLHAGIPEVDALMRDGIASMERKDLAAAERCFSRIIDRAPDFAEGWNKRATVRYLAGNHAGAIADCGETLARNPNHFGALSGQGLCHLARGEHQEAARAFRRALVIHPHLSVVRSNLRLALGELVKYN